ncbi:hypothetical protein C4J85_2367 [Pseudomonas sp. R4-34-07]|nr:hypothetical protein C4J86_2344 [Pseudomonas sp. R2-7-07]AZF52852.1 hypothetical protein C4J85_2367 [Pseudomonas sp. R4-34-07]
MAPGKGPGNWKGKLGVRDDGSVTELGVKARKPGVSKGFRPEMS